MLDGPEHVLFQLLHFRQSYVLHVVRNLLVDLECTMCTWRCHRSCACGQLAQLLLLNQRVAAMLPDQICDLHVMLACGICARPQLPFSIWKTHQSRLPRATLLKHLAEESTVPNFLAVGTCFVAAHTLTDTKLCIGAFFALELLTTSQYSAIVLPMRGRLARNSFISAAIGG